MGEELKLAGCPFCGDYAVRARIEDPGHATHEGKAIACNGGPDHNCTARTGYYFGENAWLDAAKAWNRRITPEASGGEGVEAMHGASSGVGEPARGRSPAGGEGERHRFGSPPEPVVNPSSDWCDAYADWYYQGSR